jgi:hypothetical protein
MEYNKDNEPNHRIIEQVKKSGHDNEARISVTILDSAQNKFILSVAPTATIETLKLLGQAVHSVAPDQQRLICMGRLLEDKKTLEDYGMNDSAVIHLFPKPNVVLSDDPNRRQTISQNQASAESSSLNGGASSPNVAHIPQIIMESDEVYGHNNIILSTHEAYEAMHRIRLLSFLVLIYCSIQLLRDFSIWISPNDHSSSSEIIPPGDPTDTSMPGTNNYDENLPQWENRDYAEVVICSLGVYVANLGIKATQDIQLHLVRRYVYLLALFGTSWIFYLYYCYVEELSSRETDNDIPNGKVYTDACFAVTLPLFMFSLFFIRAVQYLLLVREASQDVARRNEMLTSALVRGSQNETQGITSTAMGTGDIEQNETSGGGRRRRHQNPHLHELELQQEERSIV